MKRLHDLCEEVLKIKDKNNTQQYEATDWYIRLYVFNTIRYLHISLGSSDDLAPPIKVFRYPDAVNKPLTRKELKDSIKLLTTFIESHK